MNQEIRKELEEKLDDPNKVVCHPNSISKQLQREGAEALSDILVTRIEERVKYWEGHAKAALEQENTSARTMFLAMAAEANWLLALLKPEGE